MAVFRVEKNHSYTVMANHHLRDERLSLKSKGLLSLILSLPDDWRISIEGMTQFSSDGKDAIRSAIRELTDAGYITRAQTHSEAGTFSGYDYIVHETPAASPSSGFPTMEKPTTENPTTENPTTENPTTENPTLRNTEELSTILPPIVPHEGDETPPSAALTPPLLGEARGDRGEDSLSLAALDSSLGEGADEAKPKRKRRRSSKSVPDYEPELFERFWAAYPRGEDRQGAVAEWDSLRPDRETMLAMSRALVRQKASEEWQRGIGIPYAVRWLRRRRWEDEIKAPAPPPERAGGDLPVWN